MIIVTYKVSRTKMDIGLSGQMKLRLYILYFRSAADVLVSDTWVKMLQKSANVIHEVT